MRRKVLKNASTFYVTSVAEKKKTFSKMRFLAEINVFYLISGILKKTARKRKDCSPDRHSVE